MNDKLQTWINNEIEIINKKAAIEKKKMYNKTVPLTVLLSVAIFLLISTLAQYPILEVLTFRTLHLPMGLGIGLLTSALTVLLAQANYSPKRIQKRIKKVIAAIGEIDEEQERFAAELLEGQKDVVNFSVSGMEQQVILGDSYWLSGGYLDYIIIPVDKIEKIEVRRYTNTFYFGLISLFFKCFSSYIFYFTLETPAGKKKPDIINFMLPNNNLAQQLIDLITRKQPTIALDDNRKKIWS